MLHDQLQTVFRAVFNDPTLKIADDMDADDIEQWDSLKHIELIHEVEQAFGIKLRNAEIARLECIGDLKAVVAKHRGDLAT